MNVVINDVQLRLTLERKEYRSFICFFVEEWEVGRSSR